MMKTKVRNLTGYPVTLKANSGGIQRNLLPKPLENNKAYTIEVEANTTYREFWCAVNPTGKSQQDLILSSDDCVEYTEVTLLKREDGTVEWEGTKSRNPQADTPARPAPAGPPNTNGTQGATPGAQGLAPAGAGASRCIVM